MSLLIIIEVDRSADITGLLYKCNELPNADILIIDHGFDGTMELVRDGIANEQYRHVVTYCWKIGGFTKEEIDYILNEKRHSTFVHFAASDAYPSDVRDWPIRSYVARNPGQKPSNYVSFTTPLQYFIRKALAPVVLVIPVRNAKRYIERCLDSIACQSFQSWHGIIIDDGSDDETPNIAIDYIKSNGLQRKFTVIVNRNRMYALWNVAYAIKYHIANNHAIVGIIDGDDWFSTHLALEKIWAEYSEGHDFVYTQHICWPENRIGFSGYANKHMPRHHRRGMSHFKTFRKNLFDKIPEPEFKDQHGIYFKYTYDKAITYPASELSENMKFLDEVLYVYNRENNNNVDKSHFNHQLEIAEYLESRPTLIPFE